MRLQEQLDQKLSDRRRIMADLVVACRLKLAQLQPVQRRLAGNRRTILASRRELARQNRHHRIVAKLVVVVEILVAERDREHPLTDQRRHLVLDIFGAALVVKASRKSSHQIDRPIGRSQKQCARIRCHQSGIERRFHTPAFHGSKIKAFCATLCRHRGSPRIDEMSLRHNNFR